MHEHHLVAHQFFTEHLRNQIPRDVVGSRPESAGDNHQLRPGQRLAHRLLDVVRSVRHGHLARDDGAAIGEAAADPLLVRVQNAAEQQFAAGVDEFNVHKY